MIQVTYISRINTCGCKMANIIRSSKSGSDWTPNELVTYKIRVVYQDFATFFGSPTPPNPQVDSEVLTVQDIVSMQSDDAFTFLHTMDLVMTTSPGEESAVNDFVVHLFRLLCYTGRAVSRITRTRKDLPFWVCGEERYPKTDVCVMDDQDILLVVQEDKRHLDGMTDPEPQLVVEAIAAFYNNNNMRLRLFMLDPLQSKVIPGITMKGTTPTFYRIPVTADLVHAVQLGQCPAQETIVNAHIPALPRPAL
jgi:hypothetical protein